MSPFTHARSRPALAAVLATLALATVGLPARAAETAPPAAAPAPPAPPKGAPSEMETYQLVLLVRAPTWKKLPAEESAALQAAHLAHLTKMGDAGHAVVCGPFADQQDPGLRGACIYGVGSVAEARALAEADPVVKAGQLRIEAVTWWVGKGYMTFPKRPLQPTR